MPSPFPGMDPYVEDPSLWPDMHHCLIVYTAEALQPQIRPNYVARIGERLEVASLQVDEPQTFGFLEEARHVPYIEIIYRETGDVVTLIEVLSPANKSGEGREQYLQKQAELLNTQINLVEIDLLGSGRMTVLARTAELTEPADWRYVIDISRVQRRSQLEVYAFALKDRLPRCRIPLRAADPDVMLDLPAIFARCYEMGGYDLMVNYNEPPSVTLSKAEEAWLLEILHADKHV